MNELNKLTEQLEYLFLKQIIHSLRDRNITVKEARQLSGSFLTLEPFSSIEDAKSKITNFIKIYPSFAESLGSYITSYHKEQQINTVIDRMRKYIKDDNVDEALKIAVQ